MYSNNTKILWTQKNSDHCKMNYTKKKDYNPEWDWHDTELTSVTFQGETFECPTNNFNDIVETIMKRFPETVDEYEEIDMVDFCKKYVSVLMSQAIDIHGNLRSKTELELVRIVMCGKKPKCGVMFSDKSLDELYGKISVQKKVYAYVRDNMEKFV